jgi:hypothetical protein
LGPPLLERARRKYVNADDRCSYLVGLGSGLQFAMAGGQGISGAVEAYPLPSLAGVLNRARPAMAAYRMWHDALVLSRAVVRCRGFRLPVDPLQPSAAHERAVAPCPFLVRAPKRCRRRSGSHGWSWAERTVLALPKLRDAGAGLASFRQEPFARPPTVQPTAAWTGRPGDSGSFRELSSYTRMPVES